MLLALAALSAAAIQTAPPAAPKPATYPTRAECEAALRGWKKLEKATPLLRTAAPPAAPRCQPSTAKKGSWDLATLKK